VQLNTGQRELSLKLVYYGPALSGKTTNLRQLHGQLLPAQRGHLMELPTSDDRTLFFDTMPLLFKANGFKVKLRLFTVPGQVLHNSTRRIVLQGCDGVVFVADSQAYKRHDNYQYWANLEENLRSGGLTLDRLPHVVQWNKMDLGDESTAAAVAAMRRESRRPVYQAVAVRGEGVAETFLGMVSLLHESLDREQGLSALLGQSRAEFVEAVSRCFAQPPPLPPLQAVLTPAGGVQRLAKSSGS
jgi:signal recognition particle receptor subunit beta